MTSSFYVAGFQEKGYRDSEGTPFKKVTVKGKNLIVCPGWLTNAIVTDKAMYLEEVLEKHSRQLVEVEPPLICKEPRKRLRLVQGISSRGCFCFVSDNGLIVEYRIAEKGWDHISKRFFIPRPPSPPPLEPSEFHPLPESDSDIEFNQLPPDSSAVSSDENEAVWYRRRMRRKSHTSASTDDSDSNLFLKYLGIKVKKKGEKKKRRKKIIGTVKIDEVIDYEPLVRFTKTAWEVERKFALSVDGTVHMIPKHPSVFIGKSLEVSLSQKVKDIVSGNAHTLFLTESGAVFAMGLGSHGELGTGDLNAQETPVEIPALKGMVVESIAAGAWHSCAITESGDLYTWGWNKCGQLGIPKAPSEHTQLVYAEPQLVDFPGVESDLRVTQVSCGSSHTVIVLSDGSLWGCGWNKYGQLGFAKPENVEILTRIPFPSSVHIEKIICSWWGIVVLPKEEDVLSTDQDKNAESSADESEPPSDESDTGFELL